MKRRTVCVRLVKVQCGIVLAYALTARTTAKQKMIITRKNTQESKRRDAHFPPCAPQENFGLFFLDLLNLPFPNFVRDVLGVSCNRFARLALGVTQELTPCEPCSSFPRASET